MVAVFQRPYEFQLKSTPEINEWSDLAIETMAYLQNPAVRAEDKRIARGVFEIASKAVARLTKEGSGR